jgi:hypothetical protein
MWQWIPGPVRRGWKSLTNPSGPVPILILLVGIVGGTLAAANFLLNRIDTVTGAAENRLTKLIEASTKEAHNSQSLVSSASQQLMTAVNTTNTLSKELGAATTEIKQLKTELPALTNSLTTLEVRVNTSVKSLDHSVSTMKNSLQTTKSHEAAFLESFGILMDGELVAKTVQGRVYAFPLSDQKVDELKRARFVPTYVKLRYRSIPGWIPSQAAIRIVPTIVDHAVPSGLVDRPTNASAVPQ